jgi:hypothetical protein
MALKSFMFILEFVHAEVWSAPAKRSGDGALDESFALIEKKSKAVSPLRSATALQIDASSSSFDFPALLIHEGRRILTWTTFPFHLSQT